MKIHANARLGPKGRLVVVKRVLEQGWSLTEAAEAAIAIILLILDAAVLSSLITSFGYRRTRSLRAGEAKAT